MNTSLSCAEDTRRSNAERYVSRSMSVEETEAFEDHFVGCAECQNEVRFVSAVVAGLHPTQAPSASPTQSRRAWLWRGGALLAAAAGFGAIMVLQTTPRKEIVVLGGVREPPVYLGVPVRGAASSGDSLFDAGMGSYASRRHANAASELRAALAAGSDSVPARFFLAASLLLDDRPREAIGEFQRAIDTHGSPYRAEARYYRAKALLRLGRDADAVAELARLTPADGLMYETARVLADSVARARGK